MNDIQKIAIATVTATDKQIDQVEDLWFIRGNNGKKFFRNDHYFLQRLVEGRARDALKELEPSAECILDCKKILNIK